MKAEELRDITAEELKDILAEYQRRHFPEGRTASAMFETGRGGQPEVLVVTLPRRSPPVALPPPPKSDGSS